MRSLLSRGIAYTVVDSRTHVDSCANSVECDNVTSAFRATARGTERRLSDIRCFLYARIDTYGTAVARIISAVTGFDGPTVHDDNMIGGSEEVVAFIGPRRNCPFRDDASGFTCPLFRAEFRTRERESERAKLRRVRGGQLFARDERYGRMNDEQRDETVERRAEVDASVFKLAETYGLSNAVRTA